MHENFFKPQYKCAAGVSTPYFKINANPFSFGCLLFSKEYLNLLIKILYFCRSLWTLSLSRNFVEFCPKAAFYPIILNLWSSVYWEIQFQLDIPMQNPPLSPRQRKITRFPTPTPPPNHPGKQRFSENLFSSWAERGGGNYGKRTQEYSSLESFRTLSNIYSLFLNKLWVLIGVKVKEPKCFTAKQ